MRARVHGKGGGSGGMHELSVFVVVFAGWVLGGAWEEGGRGLRVEGGSCASHPLLAGRSRRA